MFKIKLLVLAIATCVTTHVAAPRVLDTYTGQIINMPESDGGYSDPHFGDPSLEMQYAHQEVQAARAGLADAFAGFDPRAQIERTYMDTYARSPFVAASFEPTSPFEPRSSSPYQPVYGHESTPSFDPYIDQRAIFAQQQQEKAERKAYLKALKQEAAMRQASHEVVDTRLSMKFDLLEAEIARLKHENARVKSYLSTALATVQDQLEAEDLESTVGEREVLREAAVAAGDTDASSEDLAALRDELEKKKLKAAKRKAAIAELRAQLALATADKTKVLKALQEATTHVADQIAAIESDQEDPVAEPITIKKPLPDGSAPDSVPHSAPDPVIILEPPAEDTSKDVASPRKDGTPRPGDSPGVDETNPILDDAKKAVAAETKQRKQASQMRTLKTNAQLQQIMNWYADETMSEEALHDNLQRLFVHKTDGTQAPTNIGHMYSWMRIFAQAQEEVETKLATLSNATDPDGQERAALEKLQRRYAVGQEVLEGRRQQEEVAAQARHERASAVLADLESGSESVRSEKIKWVDKATLKEKTSELTKAGAAKLVKRATSKELERLRKAKRPIKTPEPDEEADSLIASDELVPEDSPKSTHRLLRLPDADTPDERGAHPPLLTIPGKLSPERELVESSSSRSGTSRKASTGRFSAGQPLERSPEIYALIAKHKSTKGRSTPKTSRSPLSVRSAPR